MNCVLLSLITVCPSRSWRFTLETPMREFAVNTDTDRIPLLDTEKKSLLLRDGWEQFLSNAPTPCLWVTAHVMGWRREGSSRLLNELRANVQAASTRDLKANCYRIFLQKCLTPINRRVLKSRSWSDALHFRGKLECNADDEDGSSLHFHYFLWAPTGRFSTKPELLQTTMSCLTDRWLNEVEVPVSKRFRPIDIQIVGAQKDVEEYGGYQVKHNRPVHGYGNDSYDLFDDWTSSRIVHPATAKLNKTGVQVLQHS
jgi:hypothetical protein